MTVQELQQTPGRLILLTGLSGSGKTTLGNLLAKHLTRFGSREAVLIDGDMTRGFFENSLGFSPEERFEATRRMAFGAHALVQTGHDVVFANIAGSEGVRSFLRRKFPRYVEVHLDVAVETLRAHDVKGAHREAAARAEPLFVGIDLPYEAPAAPDVVVHPYAESVEVSLQRILDHLAGSGPVLGTKADTLASLQGVLRKAKVLPQHVVTFDQVLTNPELTAARCRELLGEGPLMVRSSGPEEDNAESSGAGRFLSLPSVPVEADAIQLSVGLVRDDYDRCGVSGVRPSSQ